MKTILFVLVSFIALTALLSGLIMLNNPDGSMLYLSPGLLETTPFRDFRIPGLFLALFVGGSNLISVFYFMRNNNKKYDRALLGGAVVIIWIIVQMIFLKSVHWLHIVFLIMGILIILIAYQLKGKWAV
jgi:hypothetical protein